MAKLVDKTYGEALFNLSVEEDKVDVLDGQAKVLCGLLQENPGLLELLNHPHIAREEKLQVIADCFDHRLDDDLTGFLTVIVNAGRQKFIPEILDYFRQAVKAYKHIGTAHVTTAVELAPKRRQAVEQRLLEITDYQSFDMHFHVDAAIIGGMIIRIGDKVVDSSIRTKLETLSRHLMV